MKIAIGSDERTHSTDVLLEDLRQRGHEPIPFGPLAASPADDSSDWPVVCSDVARAVASGAADEGIVCCWTGTGATIAANKVPGIRAALCLDAETARGARVWNHANVLCLSNRLLSNDMAKEILAAWFDTEPGDRGTAGSGLGP